MAWLHPVEESEPEEEDAQRLVDNRGLEEGRYLEVPRLERSVLPEVRLVLLASVRHQPKAQ